MTKIERLLKRLREAGADLPPCTELRRTYRAHCTVAGAWSWFAYCPLSLDDREHDRHTDLRYGSHWPVWVLLRAEKLIFTENSFRSICVDPVPEQDSLELWGRLPAARRRLPGAALMITRCAQSWQASVGLLDLSQVMP